MNPSSFGKHPELEQHFNRSREVFYHAESLRNFPRDSIDPGAFDAIREEIFNGVVDTYEMEYADGLTRMRSTVTQAASLTRVAMRSAFASRRRTSKACATISRTKTALRG